MSKQQWILGLVTIVVSFIDLDVAQAWHAAQARHGHRAVPCGPAAPACEVVYDEVEVVRYRTVHETAYREVRCRIARPIHETTMHQVRQTVCAPVVEWVE